MACLSSVWQSDYCAVASEETHNPPNKNVAFLTCDRMGTCSDAVLNVNAGSLLVRIKLLGMVGAELRVVTNDQPSEQGYVMRW